MMKEQTETFVEIYLPTPRFEVRVSRSMVSRFRFVARVRFKLVKLIRQLHLQFLHV